MKTDMKNGKEVCFEASEIITNKQTNKQNALQNHFSFLR